MIIQNLRIIHPGKISLFLINFLNIRIIYESQPIIEIIMNNISEESSEFNFFINQQRPKSMSGTQYSYKAMNLYYQQPIQHFLNFDFHSEQEQREDLGRMPQQTIKEMQKMKNRIKAKRFRDKKKNINELAQSKLKQLESQNAQLKQSKAYCGRCKTKIHKTQMTKILEQQKPALDLQFEPVNLTPEKTHKGKIWMALGIIMLIIGVNIHGFNKQPIEINLHSSFLKNLQKQLSNDSPSLKIPFSVKEKEDIFRSKSSDRKMQAPLKQKALLIQGGEDSSEIVQLNKDFIVQLQTQINDLGNYL